MSAPGAPLGLGLVGAGGFAMFVAGAVADLPDVVPHAVADARLTAAQALARDHDAHATTDATRLLEDDQVATARNRTEPHSSVRRSRGGASRRRGHPIGRRRPKCRDRGNP